jgi:hypothetical protein
MAKQSLSALLIIGVMTSCRSARDVSQPTEPGPAASPTYPACALVPGAVSRFDGPFGKMSDRELTERVAAGGGLVAIGFKEKGARGGVDDCGHVLVSDHTVKVAKEYLQSLGVKIKVESRYTPNVIAVINPSLVAQLRKHPLIEYVEPDVYGTYLHVR